MTTQLGCSGKIRIMKTKFACLKNVAADVRRRKPARRCVLESASLRRRLRSGGILRHAVALMAVLLATATLAFAATNDLSSALQKGLFEEEANHNLEAAVTAYQAVATQFDKDRKLAATAIFRLGEVYRKQGKTNEAAAQYERILKEFSDQTTLADLSRTLLPKGQVGDRKVEIADVSIRSAEDQEIQRIKAMIKDSPDLVNANNAQDGGFAPLHTAARSGQLRVAEFLLDNGADVN